MGLLLLSQGSQNFSPAQLPHPKSTWFSYSGFSPTVQIRVCLKADAYLKSVQQHELFQPLPHLHSQNGHQAHHWVSLLKGIPKIQKFLFLHPPNQHTWGIWTAFMGLGLPTNPWVSSLMFSCPHLILRVQFRIFHNNFIPSVPVAAPQQCLKSHMWRGDPFACTAHPQLGVLLLWMKG